MVRTLVPALAALLAVPGTAGAATLEGLGGCVRTGETLTLSGSGYAPDAGIDVFFENARATSVFSFAPIFGMPDDAPTATSGSDGTFSELVNGPAALPADRYRQTLRVRATDRSAAATTATGRLDVVQLGVRVTGRRVPPGSVIVDHLYGFPDGAPLYAHYSLRGRHRITVALGRAKAPCGELRVRTRALPVRRPARGQWLVQFDAVRRYDRATAERVRRTISVGRGGARYRPVPTTRPVS